jgi:hypothetical protein
MIEIKEKEIRDYEKRFDYIEEVFSCIIQNFDNFILTPKPESCIERFLLEDHFHKEKADENSGTLGCIKIDYPECWFSESRHNGKNVKIAEVETIEKEKAKRITIKERKKYLIDQTASLEIIVKPKEIEIDKILNDNNENSETIKEILRSGSRYMLRVWRAVKLGHRIGACGAPKVVKRTTVHIIETVFFPKYGNTALYTELIERNENSCQLHFRTHVNNLKNKLRPKTFYIKEIEKEKENIEIGNISLHIRKIPLENENEQ